MDEVKKSKTGVQGLDQILHGGIPTGHTVLVSGTSGSGKTTLTTQFLYEGAEEGETGIYYSLEEPTDNIKETSKHFGMDFDNPQLEGNVEFIEQLDLMKSTSSGGQVFEPGKFVENFKREVERIQPDRVVLDSITKFAMVFDSSPLRREKVSEIAQFLREQDVTACLLAEVPYSSDKYQVSRYQITEFVADGVIMLGYERTDSSRTRTLEVFKMRRTDHSSDIHPLRITDRGIITYPDQTAF